MSKAERMSITQHLNELRQRLMYVLGTFIIAFLISFYFASDIQQLLVRDLENRLILLGPAEILWVYLSIAGVIALVLSIPVAAYHLWAYFSPALPKRLQKVSAVSIPLFLILFLVGISFGYFVIHPVVLSFLMVLGSQQMEIFFTAERYFSFLFNMTIPFGFLFQLPMIIVFLTQLGIITPRLLTKNRKYAYLILVVISVVISPPDLISDLLVAIPLIFLYECSIILSKWSMRRKEKAILKESQS